MKRLILVALTLMMITSTVTVFAAGGKNQGDKGQGTISTGTGSQGTASQPRTGR